MAVRTTPATKVRFTAMGTVAEVLVVGGTDRMAHMAERRVHDLESKWSRFRADSELCALNRSSGAVFELTSDTFLLVSRACEAWHISDGVFDPTIVGALEELGYDRSFESIEPWDRVDTPRAAPGCGEVQLDAQRGTVRLPPGVRLDGGGIGKGLAADLIAEEALLWGASGVLVNLGGDLVARGQSPTGEGWTVSLTEPTIADSPIARIAFDEGAVATSVSTRRIWQTQVGERHHLIDPTTGLPFDSPVILATVLADQGWRAEVATKALIAHHPASSSLASLPALTMHRDHRVTLHGRMPEFVS